MDSPTPSLVADTVAALKGIPTQDALLELLRNGVVEVTFKKLDGDERVMPCTLVPAFLPPPKEVITEKKERKPSENTCAVWALESKAFRSFRYDRVTKVEVITREDYKVRYGSFWVDNTNS